MFGPALIPAAGNSVRMGRPKLLLPIGGETILERLVAAAKGGGVERTIVVIRPDDDELAGVAKRCEADVVRLAAPTPDMRATVLAGLEWIERRLCHRVEPPTTSNPYESPPLPSPPVLRGRGVGGEGEGMPRRGPNAAERCEVFARDAIPPHPNPLPPEYRGERESDPTTRFGVGPQLLGDGVPGFFLVPADHPALSPAVFRELQNEVARQRASIVLPTFAGRRGHPVWIAWSHVAGLRATLPGQGLNEYLRTQVDQTREIPWPTPEVLLDLDTPGDYENLIVTLIAASGETHVNPPHRPRALLPGSFNPVHAGHWGLAAAAREILGHDVGFEISRRNVDKPELSDAEIARRVAQFAGRADAWITRSPRFFEKAEHFPGATFVVGADTAARLVDVRYYDENAERLAAALERLAERSCRFLVAARLDRGRLLTLDDLSIPSRWRALFDAIPETLFRLDVSSTDLRRETES